MSKTTTAAASEPAPEERSAAVAEKWRMALSRGQDKELATDITAAISAANCAGREAMRKECINVCVVTANLQRSAKSYMTNELVIKRMEGGEDAALSIASAIEMLPKDTPEKRVEP
ncbi:hypothetical protein ABMY26_07175 (plasmid) [Azospirillum sp. HJ39]|uniref:hypothetical protein n=1 Tax=Azospirillum sp. HJ39 TaxID=3159496 RepID=UPI0035564364